MAQYNINKLIKSFLNQNQKNTLFQERHIIDIWHREMGDFIVQNTQSVSIKNGILVVKLINASLRFELLGMRSSIIEKLNKAVDADVVKDIIFR